MDDYSFATRHAHCTTERSDHDCSCHINPPCDACVECPAFNEENPL